MRAKINKISFLKLIWFAIIPPFIILNCGYTEQRSEKAETITKLDEIDYDIIASAIDQYIYSPKTLLNKRKYYYDSLKEGPKIRLIILFDSTKYLVSRPYLTDNTRLTDSADKYLTDRIVGENRKRFYIDSNKIHTNLNLKVLSRSFIFNNRRFMDSVRISSHHFIYNVSKPSYSEQKDKAVVYIEANGRDTDPKALLWLRKENNYWIAYDIINYDD